MGPFLRNILKEFSLYNGNEWDELGSNEQNKMF